MATSINVRLSDELEEKLKKTVEELKKETPLGAEVNNSTIVRGALDEFIKKQERKSKGIKEYSAPIGTFNLEGLMSSEKVLQHMLDSVNDLDFKTLNDSAKLIITLINLIKMDIQGEKIKKLY